MSDRIKHPFWQSLLIMVIAYIVIAYGIPLLPGSSLVPKSVVLQYMLTVLAGVLLWVSDSEERWVRFKEPIHAVLVQPQLKTVRTTLLAVFPLLIGFLTFRQVQANVSAPPNLRSIHPAPPASITFRGKQMMLAGLENPLRKEGDMAEHLKVGKAVYYQNCMACHGDFLDGQGHYASGFNPLPLNFQDNGTIAQLTESFVFWRVAKGGPGLPREATPWNSAMPAWEDFLTENEIWAVIFSSMRLPGGTHAPGKSTERKKEAPMTERIVLALVAVSLAVTAPAFAQGAADQGKIVYEKWCAQCHGVEGAGDGPAAHYMYPRPRDFTAALYQVRETASGLLPTDDDIMHAIDNGLPGTTMPGWKDQLSSGDRRALLGYIKSFSSFFADSSQLPKAIEFGSAPGGGDDAIRIGKQFYDSIGCYKCHGPVGRGDGKSAPTLKDDNGMPMFAADLTQGWRFNAGNSVEQIYKTLRTGLDGTPMPSFSDLLDQKFLTEQELWHVAQYVADLSGEQPQIRDVVRAARVEGALPGGPADSAWQTVDTYYFPLVAQIIRKPRWFAPAVDGVWIQAVHDGESVALRVSWHDRSQSPDTAWYAHIRRVYANLAQDDTVAVGPHPDQMIVQFPRRIPDGMERPYFLMGTSQDPAYQWRWSSTGGGAVTAGTAKGLERFDASAEPGVTGEARFDRGEWSVVFKRTLATADTANELQFRTGRAIPVSFFAWDGSNGEYGGRMALSSWYFLALDEPTPLRVYVSPVIAIALTLGLGMLWIRRAQRDAGRRA